MGDGPFLLGRDREPRCPLPTPPATRRGERTKMDLYKAKCADCQFWVTLEPGGIPDRPGQCRRFPPQITTRVYTNGPSTYHGRDHAEVESSTETEWPETTAAQWCGEFLETAN